MQIKPEKFTLLRCTSAEFIYPLTPSPPVFSCVLLASKLFLRAGLRTCRWASAVIRRPTPTFFAAAQGGLRHRYEGKLTTAYIKPLILTLVRYTSAEQGRRRPTPKFWAAGAGGVTTVETCVSAAT
jgi:hypothetical protein